MAFWELSSSRQMSGAGTIGPLPWDVVHKYAEVNRFSEEQEDDLHYYMGELDRVFIQHIHSKINKR